MKLLSAIPRLPMLDIDKTEKFYRDQLAFQRKARYDQQGYLLVSRDDVELHFYTDTRLVPAQNEHMVYLRVSDHIEDLYESMRAAGAPFASMGQLENKPWGQIEFAVIDVNGNLLTFGQPTP